MVLFVAVVMANFIAFAGSNDTEDYWKCSGRVGGSWKFGTAPYACNGFEFGPDQYILNNFDTFIFDTTNLENTERADYVTNLHALIKGVSKVYLLSRKQALPAEVNAWQHAILATSHQESFMSHYRFYDNEPIKLMRGDFGHGHGLMQVDDRWHFQAVTNAIGWNLIDNLNYAMDMLYSGWQKAATQPCVGSNDNWKNRARAMYSYYNGGPSKVCRFSNPNDRWAQNDKGYLQKYEGQSWERYVQSPSPDLDIDCIAKKDFPCDRAPASDDLQPGTAYITPSNRACFIYNEAVTCIESKKNIDCIKSFLDSDQVKQLTIEVSDSNDVHSNEFCNEVLSTKKIAEGIMLLKNINLRKTPGGEWLHTIEKGSNLQILDVSVSDPVVAHRYYKVKSGQFEGYIYAGDKNDFNEWVQSSNSITNSEAFVLNHRRAIVTSRNGVRSREGHQKLEQNQIVNITSFKVTGEENEIYYTIEGETYYGGKLLPFVSTQAWFSAGTSDLYSTTNDFYYQWLNYCPSTTCVQHLNYLIGGKMEALCHDFRCDYKKDRVQVLQSSGDWLQVFSIRHAKVGWIEGKYINYE